MGAFSSSGARASFFRLPIYSPPSPFTCLYRNPLRMEGNHSVAAMPCALPCPILLCVALEIDVQVVIRLIQTAIRHDQCQ